MVGQEEVINQMVNMFPPEVASQISFWIQAIGGIFVVYLVILLFRTYSQYKMSRDIKLIKKKLKIKG